jgi:hypothetical protein
MKYNPAVHKIPPGCGCFHTAMGVVYFDKPTGIREALTELFAGNSWRGIVCAVAYMAWMRERKRIHALWDESACEDREDHTTLYHEMGHCNANAAAWLALAEDFVHKD